MRYLITLAAAVFITTMSCAQAVEHLFLPNVLFKSDASVFSFVPDGEYARNYSNSEYSLTYEKTEYKLGINFMDTPGSMEELSKSINAEIEASAGIKVYANEMYKGFLLIQILDGAAAPQDSVRASHILLDGNANDPAEYQLLLAKADSLRNVIIAKNNFAQMAAIYGTDGTKEVGGDLGWFTKGMMVKPFEDACFSGNVGDIKVITTQFGVHLIQINSKKLASDAKAEETGSFIELALSIVDGDFIVSFNTMVTEKSKLDINRLKKMIDSVSILTPAQADKMVGYPMTEQMFVAAQTQAYQQQDENLYYALTTLYVNQYSFSEYFGLKRNYRSAYYSLSDYLDMIFNEKGNSDLVRLRELTGVENDIDEIMNAFPDFQERFYSTISSEVFKDSVYVAYVGITNSTDHIATINYFSIMTELENTLIYQFKSTPNGWTSENIALPKEINASDPNGPEWDFESTYGSDVMVINVWKAHKYFIKNNTSATSEWVAIDQLPATKAELVMVELGADVTEDAQFSSTSFYFPTVTGKAATQLDKIARSMTESGETYTCEEATNMFDMNNVVKLTNGECCMDYALGSRLKSETSPELRAFSSGLRAENLDADSDLEYFVFYVSNGKVIGASGVDLQNGKYVSLDKKVILKYLKTQKLASNLCLYSLMQY